MVIKMYNIIKYCKDHYQTSKCIARTNCLIFNFKIDLNHTPPPSEL